MLIQRKFFAGILWLILSGFVWTTQAQSNLYLKLNSTGTTTIALNSIDKITFNSGSMVFNYLYSSPASYYISDISRITFDPYTSVKSIIEDVNTLSAYPNPVHSILFIKGLSDKETQASIYNLNGTIVLKSEITENGISLESLRPGLYILKINNQTLKFSKI